jgi:hypothetical protein
MCRKRLMCTAGAVRTSCESVWIVWDRRFGRVARLAGAGKCRGAQCTTAKMRDER